IATLIAGLLTIGELLRQRELVATWAAGVSQFRLLTGLLPLLLFLGACQVLLSDQVVPRTTDQLRERGVGEFRSSGLLSSDDGDLWLHGGDDVVRVAPFGLRAARLVDLTPARREGGGVLVERLDAARAADEGVGGL